MLVFQEPRRLAFGVSGQGCKVKLPACEFSQVLIPRMINERPRRSLDRLALSVGLLFDGPAVLQCCEKSMFVAGNFLMRLT